MVVSLYSLFPVPCSFHSAFRVMFSRMPMLASVTNTEVPPDDISGSGIHLVGTSDNTTLMLKKACSTMVVVMPNATSRANGS